VLDGIAEKFLEDYGGKDLPWIRPPGAPASFSTDLIWFGRGETPMEVALGHMGRPGRPPGRELRALHRKRQANRPAPVLLVVLYVTTDGQPRATMAGTSEGPPHEMTVDQAARICRAVLDEPDRHAAVRTSERLLKSLDSILSPGLSNCGLFASHELHTGVPARADWEAARRASIPLLGFRGSRLMRHLGYEIQQQGSAGVVLTCGGQSHAVAVFLDDTEVFDRASRRFGAVSPAAHGLMLAARERLPWLVVVRGAQIRLYPSSPDAGVGRRGQAETYAELDLAVLAEQEAGYLTLLFAPTALAPGGTAEEVLRASENFAADLGKRLRERIYREVVPGLALAIARLRKSQSQTELAEVYDQALLILFRILFLAYAEDRGLLPYSRNPRYDRHAVKAMAREFASDPAPVFDDDATGHWDDMQTVWSAVDKGNMGWDVPAYNGGLFARDPARNRSGAALDGITLTDADFGPCLRALLVDTGEDGADGPVDFRSLGVREFSVIYEGLIESELAISVVDLSRDSNGLLTPASAGEEIDIPAGQVYMRDRLGKRKATGTYFTKTFVVEHLLNTALEPALYAHLTRIRELLDHGDEAGAAEAFFDFRVADPAMGSGHFLVAAVDRIEAKFTAFLTEHPIPSVTNELAQLSQKAREFVGLLSANVEMEVGTLLRRQISRRCIYGIDASHTAVELAKLAIWIHTCVPGLPLPTLNLVCGNSLTGIGTIDEVLDVLEPQPQPGQASLFATEIETALTAAKARLMRVARATEATRLEVEEVTGAFAAARRDAADAKAFLDAAIGIRLGIVPLPNGSAEAIAAGNSTHVQAKLADLQAAQFPYLFPEAFVRDRPGFDVLIGNPPWEKLQVEEHSFYALHFPGLRSMPQHQATAEIARIRIQRPDLAAEYAHDTTIMRAIRTALARGPYPGLTSGRPDLYKAFAWRMWHLVRPGGYIGVVLPRKALEASGMKDWRRAMLTSATFTDVTTLTNTEKWVFDEVHGQYTLGLVTIRADKSAETNRRLPLRGPFHSFDQYRAGVTRPGGELRVDDFLGWSDAVAFPQIPDETSLEIFLAMREHPRLDQDSVGWSVRGLRELNATDDRDEFEFTETRGTWPVYKGESFERWKPETGAIFARARSDHIIKVLQARRLNQVRNQRSAFYQMPIAWSAAPCTLPAMHPRIAWRDVARATDTQTVIAALVPPKTILTHQAYYLFWREGTVATQAYVLGVLSALPFDWYARQIVESHITIEFMRSAPVPRVPEEHPLRRRVVEIAGRLAAVDHRYADWAYGVGVAVGSVKDEAAKRELIAELDGIVALLYCLKRPQVEHIFATFHRGWDYRSRLSSALSYYDKWILPQAAKAS
jgi:hypothetical protein